jgi:hypothetical protein
VIGLFFTDIEYRIIYSIYVVLDGNTNTHLIIIQRNGICQINILYLYIGLVVFALYSSIKHYPVDGHKVIEICRRFRTIII